VTIDPRRSLVVTEEAILARFPLERVLDQLVAQSGVAGLTSLELFHQWWDTQNPGPSLGLGPHCDDTVHGSDNPIRNDFPYTCRPDPAEGGQIDADPFAPPATNPDAYIPIGLFNRFDLTPADGSHCGEYRIVYAKRSGVTIAVERHLLIFEAILPNPHPNQGLKDCRKIVDFWADLSKEGDIEKRGDDLEQLYFEGFANVEPVVHVRHCGFTHVTERQTEVVDGQKRFLISPALINVFLPQRQQIMEDYLNDKLKKPKKPKETLSGRKTH
jgi:hypothetical protein